MRARFVFPLVALGLGLAGCQPASNICGDRPEPMLDANGAELRCAVAEDCPRPNNILVCAYDGLLEDECVSCTDTRCVRHIPEPCQ